MMLALSMLLVVQPVGVFTGRPPFAPARPWQDRQIVHQVRIQQRIVVRIPTRETSREAMLAKPVDPRTGRVEEKRIGRCLPLSGLRAMTRSGDETLDLFLSDGRRVRAYLADGCEARDFYSGFYVERQTDGRLCSDRDMLHSRSGAKCEVDKLREIRVRD